MIKTFIKFLLVALLLGACKKEFSEIGNDITNPAAYRFKTYTARHIKFYSHPVEHVHSIGQPLIAIGVYDQPAYGKTEADLRITFNNSPDFGSTHFLEADSILYAELRIPFFSKKDEEQSTSDLPVYKVDSVFGGGPIKLSVYYNDYYFFPYDPNAGFSQAPSYYSDFNFMMHNQEMLFHDDQFTPDLSFYVDTIPNSASFDDMITDKDLKEGLRKDTIGPQFHIPLDTTFFRHKIFDRAGQPLLTNPDLFRHYFRGLYVHAEAVGNGRSLMLFDGGKVYLYLAYRYSFINKNGTPNDTSDDFVDHAYEKILLQGLIKVNIFRNDFHANVQQAITAANPSTGQDKVYLKGAAGSMGIVKLFDPAELYELRNNNWLINQANLRFYVDETEMAGVSKSEQPTRLFLYKYDYRQPVSDLNPTLDNGQQMDYSKILGVYDGQLQEDTVNHLHYYDINITRHIKEILRKDSADVRLGVRIVPDLQDFVQNINTRVDPDAYTPFGTVLQGNLSADRPVELKIYYTEPQD